MRRKIVMRGMMALALASSSYAQKHTVSLTEHQAIRLTVSGRSLNRLSIQGDRIQEVIGLDDVLTVERSDHHGHLFVRFPEGYKNTVDMTLITEGGLVQDLSLTPADQEATTIVLKAPNKPKDGEDPKHNRQTQWRDEARDTPLSDAVSLPQQVIGIMKLLVNGGGDVSELVSETHRTSSEGVMALPVRHMTHDRYTGHVFSITNTSKTVITLLEKDFYHPGDVGIAVGQKTLVPGASTLLFVVRLGSIL